MTTHTLAQLQAMPDRELDAVVARVVMGEKLDRKMCGECDLHTCIEDPADPNYGNTLDCSHLSGGHHWETCQHRAVAEPDYYSAFHDSAALVRAEIGKRGDAVAYAYVDYLCIVIDADPLRAPVTAARNIAFAPPRAHAIAAVLACQSQQEKSK